jgi:hypothetical protein
MINLFSVVSCQYEQYSDEQDDDNGVQELEFEDGFIRNTRQVIFKLNPEFPHNSGISNYYIFNKRMLHYPLVQNAFVKDPQLVKMDFAVTNQVLPVELASSFHYLQQKNGVTTCKCFN